MPEKHRLFAEQWSPERFSRWAEKIGPATGALITHVLQARRHPEQSYRSCLGILRLAKTYSDARLEAAAQRALTVVEPQARLPMAQFWGLGFTASSDRQFFATARQAKQ